MIRKDQAVRGQAVAIAAAAAPVRVWDPLVRILHWTVVACCAANLLLETEAPVHKAIGYLVAAALTVRIAWGIAGRGHARFAAFVPRPAALRAYLRAWLRRREPRYLGHNPAGAVMIVTLLAVLFAVSVTGWMLGLDLFFGNQTLEYAHKGLALSLVPLVAVHVLAAIYEGMRHRENLIMAMVTGRKRAPGGSDVAHAPDAG